MNIPKSYEALAADLASEKIISKTLLGQKEAYMMLADKGRLDLATWKQKACEAAEREAALREELSGSNRRLGACINQIEEQQQRLTVAEQRLSQVEGACDLAMSAIDDDERGANFVKIIQAIKDKAALKPASGCEHSFHYFGDYPRRRCNNCNALEVVAEGEGS